MRTVSSGPSQPAGQAAQQQVASWRGAACSARCGGTVPKARNVVITSEWRCLSTISVNACDPDAIFVGEVQSGVDRGGWRRILAEATSTSSTLIAVIAIAWS